MRSIYNFLIILENIFLVSFVTFFLPIIVSLLYKEYEFTKIFLLLSIFSLGINIFLRVLRKIKYPYELSLKNKNSILFVSMSWLIISILGAIPYFLSSKNYEVFSSIFESVSGWTTTGTSFILSPENISYSLIFYRSLLTYFGGLGIVIFMGVIINVFGSGVSSMLFNDNKLLEQNKSNISNRLQVRYFLIIYLVLTGIETIILLILKINLFDSIVLSFGSISTGGTGIDFFSISKGAKLICSIFSILGALNFLNYIVLIKGRVRDFFRNVELRYFLLFIFCSTLFIGFYLFFTETFADFRVAISKAFFSTVSFITTTGFLAEDYSNWPRVTILILFILLVIGGCSNSTSSSLKVIRFITLINIFKRNVYKRVDNNSIIQVRLGRNSISSDQATNIVIFLLIYIACFVVGTFLISLEGHSISLSAQYSISAISNTGIIFSNASSVLVTEFSNYLKSIYSILMLLGRLEFFALIIIFIPGYFRK